MAKQEKYEIELPGFVNTVIERLNSNGFEGYIVGGCVRDIIREREPKDWDIATSALPEQVIEIFDGFKVIPTGIKHGTVTVVVDGNPVEITTYRTEGKYADHRHPSEIAFVSSLEADLARRDFAMNSIAYHPKNGLVDVYGGKKDIENKIVRCVGNPMERFGEDALRIMRALRFAAVFNYEIDPETKKAIFACKHLLEHIAKERIREEFSRILVGHSGWKILDEYREVIAVFIPEIIPMFGYKQRSEYHKYDIWRHTIATVKSIDDSLEHRLAAFFHDIGKPKAEQLYGDEKHQFKNHQKISWEMTEEIMARLRYDNKTIHRVVVMVRNHDFVIPNTTKHMKKILNRIGEQSFFDLLAIREADIYAQADKFRDERIKEILTCRSELCKLMATKPCFTIKDLAVDGHDMIARGYQGKEIGEKLRYYLDLVLNEKCENTKEALLNYKE